MSPAAYRVEPIARDQRREAVAALAEAFQADPLFAFTIPDDRQRARWLPHGIGEMMAHCGGSPYSRAAFDADGRVAGAMLAGPYPPPLWFRFRANVRLSLYPTPWEPDFRHFRRIFRYLKQWEAMHYKGPHVYVYIIGVRPAHQGRGVGRMLMESLHAEAAARGLPVYLETQTERNVAFYRGLGYRLTEEHRPFVDGPPTWGFFRELV